MKRTFLILLTLMLTVCALMCGCRGGCNKEILDLQYAYNHAYIQIGDEWIDLPITRWTDYEGEQLQITLTDGTKILVSSINCILYYGELPIP